MTPEEYAAAMAAITSGLAAYVRGFSSFFTQPVLSDVQWVKFLQQLFPEVERRYANAADLARTFYDYQRRQYHPELPDNAQYSGRLKFSWFVKNMQPARRDMQRGESPQSAVTKLSLSVIREVEMGARRQIIRSTDTEPEPRKVVQGWARVATGAETCAWCLMLISRGPVYKSPDVAGISLDSTTVEDLWAEAGQDLQKFHDAVDDHVDEWHAGCDCLVIPVFDVQNWPGKRAQVKALQSWIAAGKEASRLIESGEARSKNENRETLNALRRQLERGDISMSDYAFAA